ncbi:unnamed protein product [Linum tenue]|uniref:Uncharacterized protein n=2 Tax=Linum tenue TaxID=586396 RepID=A0AAV0NIQ0_9ROSI|nr:unnamed protein product [Linum tenue]CAI0458613.1 unnamed protein product [Linum tenue]
MDMDSVSTGDNNTSSLLEAQSHVWHHAFNFVTSMSIKCAVQLGLPEAVGAHAGPISLPDLVSSLGLPPSKAPYLHRLLRLVAHSGFLSLHTKLNDVERYSLTPAGRFLLSDNPYNAGSLLLAVLDPVLTEPFHHMSAWFRSEKTTFSSTHGGKMAWEYMATDAVFSDLFNDAMARDSCMIAELVVKEGRSAFEGVGSLVDVAGGTGNMAKAVAKAFPGMSCTVLDLPHVVSGLEDGGNNVKYVAGDMFESIPAADAVLLKWIMHDWDDEKCVKILRKCRTAVTGEGKDGQVIIIDMVLGNQSLDEKLRGVQYAFDMEMMVSLTGKERSEEEFAKLFFDAGFSSYHINPILGTRALIQVYP